MIALLSQKAKLLQKLAEEMEGWKNSKILWIIWSWLEKQPKKN